MNRQTVELSHYQPAARDFSKETLSKLASRDCFVVGLQSIPDNSSPMPWANSIPGYVVSVRGVGSVLTHIQVMTLAQSSDEEFQTMMDLAKEEEEEIATGQSWEMENDDPSLPDPAEDGMEPLEEKLSPMLEAAHAGYLAGLEAQEEEGTFFVVYDQTAYHDGFQAGYNAAKAELLEKILKAHEAGYVEGRKQGSQEGYERARAELLEAPAFGYEGKLRTSKEMMLAGKALFMAQGIEMSHARTLQRDYCYISSVESVPGTFGHPAAEFIASVRDGRWVTQIHGKLSGSVLKLD